MCLRVRESRGPADLPGRDIYTQRADSSAAAEAPQRPSVCGFSACVCVWDSNWQNLLSITKQEGWSHLTSPAWLTGPGDQSQSQTGFRPTGERLSCFLQVNFSFSNYFFSLYIWFFFSRFIHHPSIIPSSFPSGVASTPDDPAYGVLSGGRREMLPWTQL